jgi:hypothetical protein
MDLKLFVLHGGQQRNIRNFHSTKKVFFGFHECTSTEEPRGGRGRRKDRGEVKMCRCCGIAGTLHLSPPSLCFLHLNKKQDFLDVDVTVRPSRRESILQKKQEDDFITTEYKKVRVRGEMSSHYNYDGQMNAHNVPLREMNHKKV